MLRSETLFGKRENNTNTPSPLSSTSTLPTGIPSIPKAPPASQSTGSDAPLSSIDEGGSKLIVGPNIKLKGVEITDCDTLVVEGRVEATINSRVIQIAEGGAFKGSAEVDIAEIRGEFDGDLTARQKLMIRSPG